MKSKILETIGIDPAIILIVMFILIVALIVLFVSVYMKYNRLRSSYNTFMKGKDGKTMEDSIFERFEALEELVKLGLSNRQEIKKIRTDMKDAVQKVGILRYDAFSEMGGKLSFALTLLDGNNTGYIINSMHSREGCYNYIKEIVKGESYIELSEEEAESLERAIYQEMAELKLDNQKETE